MSRARNSFFKGNPFAKSKSSEDRPQELSEFFTDFKSPRVTLNPSEEKYESKEENNLDFSEAVLPRGLFSRHAFHQADSAERLLKATEYAAYKLVKALIKNNPSLMFKAMNVTFHCNGHSKCTSPLKRAFEILDPYMCSIFYNRIKNNETYRKEFLKQIHEQARVGHVNLEPLFRAYEEYHRLHHLSTRGCITHESLIYAWRKLGKEQRRLPVHLLIEILRRGDTWSECSFNVDQPRLSDCRVYTLSRADRVGQSLSSILADSGWGTFFSLVRGSDMKCYRVGKKGSISFLQVSTDWVGSLGASMYDLAAFRYLLDVRHYQLSRFSKNIFESQEQPHQRVEAISQAIPRHG